ncbi:hypothetical protein HN903_01090 [archaeon]|jgi:hypothetical protein|nr:hypothetical protein [archaeon]MBT7128327.1 hypothetical protein [archaeon]
MTNQKTFFTWFLIIFVGLMIVWQSVNLISVLFNVFIRMNPSFFSMPLLSVNNLISAIGLVLTVVLFVKLWKMSPDSKRWINITFGYYVVKNLFKIFILLPMLLKGAGDTVMGSVSQRLAYFSGAWIVLYILIDLIVWWLLYRHVSKRQDIVELD